ncbi:putative chitinase 3, partial [Orchesella cincta]
MRKCRLPFRRNCLPHSKCIQFNICLDGEAAEMTCPFGLYYNPETTQCDFPENVSGCRGGTRPPISTTTPYISTEDPATTTELPPIEMTKCGESIIADNGTIMYKLNEGYDAGELCVFMIKFESGYIETTFTLDTHGLESDSDAVTIQSFTLDFYVNLGLHQQNVTFDAYGVIVIFRTNSSLGTGFQLSFKKEGTITPGELPGTAVAFNNENNSPLSIPFPSNATGPSFNYFVFTSDSKFVSESDSFFRLTLRALFGESLCHSVFAIYSFEDELKYERSICGSEDNGNAFEFSTRGLFLVYQVQHSESPITTGLITWSKVSNH